MSAKNASMQDLLVTELRDIYNAERQLTKALPKLAQAAQTPELKQAFEMHLEQTRSQVERLQQVFELLDVPARGKPCHAMEGLVEEANEIIEMNIAPALKDAALIAAAQKVEHYEIASYGTVHAYAEAVGNKEVANLLAETLREEKETDMKLNQLAVGSVNKKAMQASKAA